MGLPVGGTLSLLILKTVHFNSSKRRDSIEMRAKISDLSPYTTTYRRQSLVATYDGQSLCSSGKFKIKIGFWHQFRLFNTSVKIHRLLTAVKWFYIKEC